jgi:two-component system OmpR family response regulator
MKILVVEDDPTLGRNIKDSLSENEHEVVLIPDGLKAEQMLEKNNFDCVVLDINLPGKNGYELCRQFRTYNQVTPVIMLTAYNQIDDKIQGFDAGADDYLSKPFYMKELLLRVNVLSKRVKLKGVLSNEQKSIQVDDLIIEPNRKKVSRQGTEIALTPREYTILIKLIENKGEVVSKRDLIRDVWGTSIDVNTNTIEVYINFLRNKIDKPFNKNNIKTRVGYGYYFDSP